MANVWADSKSVPLPTSLQLKVPLSPLNPMEKKHKILYRENYITGVVFEIDLCKSELLCFRIVQHLFPSREKKKIFFSYCFAVLHNIGKSFTVEWINLK